jgi:L-cysteate sulfo-lyase
MADMSWAPLRLGSWPTPVEPMPRLGAAIGLGPDDLWIKRDDLTGLGAGGNKVRKLEYLCGQAAALGATALITSGAAQSNHARITAAAAARMGVKCTLVLWGSAPSAMEGNLLLDVLAGAELVWAGDEPMDAVISRTSDQLREQGEAPFVVPYGGSSPDSARGYIDCATELLDQLPGFDRVVVAVGSGGTMAGLVAGLGPERVVGVDTGAVADAGATVTGLLAAMPGAPSGELRILGEYVGEGYSTIGPATRAALETTARTEGIFLDPIYTGRAMAGLLGQVESGAIAAGTKTVFLHTGGLPGLLARTDVLSL